MAVRPVIRGSAADLMGQQNAAATARFRQPPRPPSSAPASFTTTGPPPPPRPAAQSPQAAYARSQPGMNLPRMSAAQAAPLNFGSQNTTAGGVARTLPAPAYANANANASFLGTRQPGGLEGRWDVGNPNTTGMGVVRPQPTAQDMVDVPGVGQLPRALLQNLQQRMQQRQQQGPPPIAGRPLPMPPGGLPYRDPNAPQQNVTGYWSPQDEANRQRSLADPTGALAMQRDRELYARMQLQGGARPNDNRFGPPVSGRPVPEPGPTTGARWTTAGQGPNMITNPAWRGPAPVDPGFDRPYGSDNPGPPVSGRPVVDQGAMWGARPGNPATPPAPGGPFSSYGNDNIGVGVTPPTMISQPGFVPTPGNGPPGGPSMPTLGPVFNPGAPQNPMPPVMNPAPPGPPPPPPTMNTGPAAPINPSLLNPSMPEITSLGQYQMHQPGATPQDFASYQQAYRNRSMTGPGGPPPPPGGYNSPFLPHVAGGGPAAFGAGPSPNPWAGPSTTPGFGPAMPNLPPAAQQAYQNAWANDMNRDPYQTGGAVYNGAPAPVTPSWY